MQSILDSIIVVDRIPSLPIDGLALLVGSLVCRELGFCGTVERLLGIVHAWLYPLVREVSFLMDKREESLPVPYKSSRYQ